MHIRRRIRKRIYGLRIKFNLAAIAPILILCGVVMFFHFKAQSRKGQFGRILLGLAFIMIAINQIVLSTEPLRANAELSAFFNLLHNYLILSFAAGTVLAICCVSSLAAVIVSSSLYAAQVLNFQAALWMVLGANAGSTILALLTTMFASRIGRRGPSATALLRSLMILVAMISLEFNVQNFVSLPDNVVLWHLVFNLAVGLLGLLIIHPLSHWTESILSTPEEDTEPNVNYKKLFVQEISSQSVFRSPLPKSTSLKKLMQFAFCGLISTRF